MMDEHLQAIFFAAGILISTMVLIALITIVTSLAVVIRRNCCKHETECDRIKCLSCKDFEKRGKSCKRN